MRRIIFTCTLAVALAFALPPLLAPPQSVARAEAPPAATETPEAAAEAEPPVAETEASPAPILDAGTPLTVLTAEGPAELTMADWLPLAVAGEMPADFAPEALKAQAVALRSYALYYRAARKAVHPEADVCVSSGCCAACAAEDELRALWGMRYEENRKKIAAAVAATDGQYLVWEGESALTVFHSSSLGHTEDGASLGVSAPYLVSVATPETEETVRRLVTTVELTPLELRRGVEGLCPGATFPEDPAQWLGETVRTPAGRVEQLRIGSERVSGTAIRTLFALRSTDFDLSYSGGVFVFTVRGFGHGLGMSQYGADALARAGGDYREILAHYYPGTELVMAALVSEP